MEIGGDKVRGILDTLGFGCLCFCALLCLVGLSLTPRRLARLR